MDVEGQRLAEAAGSIVLRLSRAERVRLANRLAKLHALGVARVTAFADLLEFLAEAVRDRTADPESLAHLRVLEPWCDLLKDVWRDHDKTTS